MSSERPTLTRGARAPETTAAPAPERLLATPLPTRVLGQEVAADLYLRNGFRLVGASAGDDEDELERRCQTVRNLLGLAPEEALSRAVGLGYGEQTPLEAADVQRALAHLRSPRLWLLDSLFWPHVAADTFADGSGGPSLLQEGAHRALTASLASTNGRGGALTQHALAVVEHNRALAAELAFAAGHREWAPEAWREALATWARTLDAEAFWAYLWERVEEWDDPTLGSEELKALRSELPTALLAFHGLFARVYARAGWKQASAGHLDLVRQAPFPCELRDQALATAAREVAGALLTPLLHAVDQDLLGFEGHLSRRELADILEPTLAEAGSLCRFLSDELELSKELFVASAFDDLASRVHQALDRKLDYSGDERERNLLCGLRVRRRLLELPFSRPVERKLEQEVRKDAHRLWGEDYDPEHDPDPGECWFLPGATADPEASLVMPLHRVTDRKLEINPLEQSAGVRVFWQGRRLLVPRSELARACHMGQALPTELPPSLLDPEAQRLLGQIRQIESDHSRDRAEREASLQVDLQAAELELERALASHDQRAHAEAAAGEEELAAVESRLHDQLLQAEQARDRSLAQTVTAGKSRLRQARHKLAATEASQGGLRGGLARELPVGAALALTLGGVIPALGGPGLLEGASFSWPGALLGLLLALLWGRSVRRHKIRHAAATVQAAESALEADQKEPRARYANQARGLKGAAEKEKAAIRQRLAGLDRIREKLRANSEKRREELRRAAERENQRLEREKEASVAPLGKQLIDHLGVRPEKAKKRFPPLKKALAAGFQPGSEPTPAEMKMTPAEELQARLQLAMLLRR